MSRKTVVATMPASTDHVDTVGPKRRGRQVADGASDGGLQPDDLMAIQRKVDAIAAAGRRRTDARRNVDAADGTVLGNHHDLLRTCGLQPHMPT
jgi:hypothetical protein